MSEQVSRRGSRSLGNGQGCWGFVGGGGVSAV